MKRFLSTIALCSFTSVVLSCGEPPGSCTVEVQCDGTACVGVASSCLSGSSLDTEEVDGDASCEAHGERTAIRRGGSLNVSTWDPDGDC